MEHVGGRRLDVRSVLAVCAHPDDESFGLGAVLSTLAELGVETRVLCFTHGEASTLGADGPDLATVRAAELAGAAAQLGVRSVRLLTYPDGGLTDIDLDQLGRDIDESVATDGVDCLLAFDEGGITGHPDHQQATRAALAHAARVGVPVLAWTVPAVVASALNREFGTSFVGRTPAEVDYVLEVVRACQHRAIAYHASQSSENPVLWRRLALQGATELLVWLRRPDSAG